jgi:hypothetical protein
MFGVLVYEIVTREEPHVDVDETQVGVLIRWVLFAITFETLIYICWESKR